MHRVLATVGTDYHPFDRFVSWVDGFTAATRLEVEVTIQYGKAQPPRTAAGVPVMEKATFLRALAEADVVVCQGGPGSIMDARATGKIPIVVPRRSDLGEHVDDHQLRFSRFLASQGKVVLAEDREALVAAVERAIAEPQRFRHTDEPTDVSASVHHIGTLIDGLVAGSRTRRSIRVPGFGWVRAGTGVR